MRKRKSGQSLHPEDQTATPSFVPDVLTLMEIMTEMTLAKERYEDRTSEGSTQSEFLQSPFTNEQVPIPLKHGKQDFEDFQTQFRIIAKFREWSEDQKATYLPGSLG